MELMDILSDFQKQGYDTFLEGVEDNVATIVVIKDGVEETRQVTL